MNPAWNKYSQILLVTAIWMDFGVDSDKSILWLRWFSLGIRTNLSWGSEFKRIPVCIWRNLCWDSNESRLKSRHISFQHSDLSCLSRLGFRRHPLEIQMFSGRESDESRLRYSQFLLVTAIWMNFALDSNASILRLGWFTLGIKRNLSWDSDGSPSEFKSTPVWI